MAMAVKGRPDRRVSRTRWIWISYWLALFIVTHRPGPAGVGLPIPGADKAIHFALYFALVLLGGRYLRATGRRLTFSRLVAWACVYAAYGAFDEWLQQFVGRSMSFYDWLADLVGIAGATAVLYFRRRADRSDPNERSACTPF